MSIEISIPFRLDASNSIAVETDPNAQIRQHVMGLINTEPGERSALGNYGVPLSDMLFEAADEVVAQDVAEDIAQALATFEPGVVVQSSKAVPGIVGDGVARVDVQYLRVDAPDTNGLAPRNTNTAVITASGKVIEVVRG